MDSDNDLLSASLESINSSKRVEKFQRECAISLSNAQEWIKAELSIVSGSIDFVLLKEELKSNKTSARRKHLLSALIFEHAAREATQKHQASTATVMAMHMLNHIWHAKYELYEPQSTSTHTSQSAISKNRPKKKNAIKNAEQELWREAEFEDNEENTPITRKPKKKTNKKLKGMFSKVRDKLPLKIGTKKHAPEPIQSESSESDDNPNNSLLDNPNNSSIMVNPGLSESIDDSLIQQRPKFSDDPNESGITVRKVLKRHEHETQDPGSNTVIMKLSSKSGKNGSKNLSVPEKCQRAVNDLCLQFPGYDIVAIRNMAAQKVGVSLQYIENLNILPDNANL